MISYELARIKVPHHPFQMSSNYHVFFHICYGGGDVCGINSASSGGDGKVRLGSWIVLWFILGMWHLFVLIVNYGDVG